MYDIRHEQAIRAELDEIERSFKKKFSEAQIKSIIKSGLRVPIEFFKETCEKIIDNNRWMPLPKDFKVAFRAYHDSNKTESKIVEEKIDCTDCNDSGFCFADTGNENDFLVLICHCAQGEQKEKSEKLIPRIEKHQRGVLRKYPSQMFVPNEKDFSGLLKKLAWFEGVLDKSRNYGKDKVGNS